MAVVNRSKALAAAEEADINSLKGALPQLGETKHKPQDYG